MRRTFFVYSDSTSFPRSHTVRPEDSWPMKIVQGNDMLYLRGFGGATSSQLISLMERDSSYFGFQMHDEESENIVIFAAGIVDVAPRPITYKLKIISKIPLVGSRLWIGISFILRRHRVTIQRIARYKLVSYRRCRKNIRKISKIVINTNVRILITETPVPSQFVLDRSPYFKENVERLNRIKLNEVKLDPRLEFVPIGIDKEGDYISKEDGHHYSVEGHQVVAEQILRLIKK